MPIITLPEPGLSRSAERRAKSWIKTVSRVDTTNTTGYAFVGRFLRWRATVELDEGTWVMTYIETRRYDGEPVSCSVELLQVRDGELVHVETLDAGIDFGWALRIRDEVARHVNPEDPMQALTAERARLLTRLAEIDELIAEHHRSVRESAAEA